MKLLILTQKVDKNDDVLGFMHGWIAEFAKHCEKVTVIALGVGEYDLPRNVKVLSLGKDKTVDFRGLNADKMRNKFENHLETRFPSGKNRQKYILNFYKYIWQERKNYDNVFVHMNQVYVILGGLLWRLWGKKIGLWYAHGTVTLSLRLAEKMTNYVFTSTESGFRINSKKKKMVGQGINIDFFSKSQVERNHIFKIVTIGRFSMSKDIETLILAAEILKNQNKDFRIQVLGGPLTKDDELYFKSMKALLETKQLEEYVELLGAIAYKNIPDYLNQADIFVNMGKTGSLDKTILESMAMELPTLTCNEAVLEVFGDYKNNLMYTKNNFKQLAERFDWLYNMQKSERQQIGTNLRKIVEEDHSLRKLVIKILNVYRK